MASRSSTVKCCIHKTCGDARRCAPGCRMPWGGAHRGKRLMPKTRARLPKWQPTWIKAPNRLRSVDLIAKHLPAPAGLAPAERRIDHYRQSFNSCSRFFVLSAAHRAAERTKNRERGSRGCVSSCQSRAPLGQAQRGREPSEGPEPCGSSTL